MMRSAGRCVTTLPQPANGAYTVVGVVRDLRSSLFVAPAPELYISALQRPLVSIQLMVRSSVDPASLSKMLRGAVAAVDREQPISDVVPMATLVWESTEYVRFRAALLTAFAIVAIGLAASGIAAVVMRAVVSRTRELGIRAAIGATPSQLVILVLRDLGLPTVAGVSAGLLASYAIAYTVLRFLFVEPLEPGLSTVAVTAVVAVALLAAWLPARRILRLDPVAALRAD
jgi:putative ABC transport system permease protein